MKCKRHPCEQGAGVCAPCLRDRLLIVLADQHDRPSPDLPRGRRNPPSVLLPLSSSADTETRSSGSIHRRSSGFFPLPLPLPLRQQQLLLRRLRRWLVDLDIDPPPEEQEEPEEEAEGTGVRTVRSGDVAGDRRARDRQQRLRERLHHRVLRRSRPPHDPGPAEPAARERRRVLRFLRVPDPRGRARPRRATAPPDSAGGGILWRAGPERVPGSAAAQPVEEARGPRSELAVGTSPSFSMLRPRLGVVSCPCPCRASAT
ncbi:uncharacterized protein M6B38_390205 [Iris pallida]|uniref:Uncharacterized protein n=1 Tax=Iris pallida TaxID=29817 RepID=A0AAX6G0V5_IRIPA|nr:uncharacterized protein M6B38_390205 [Iris pallida]